MTKIAIIRRNGLGDLLCAYPLIRTLQERGDVTLFVEKRNAPLLSYLPKINHIVLPERGNKYLKMWWTARKFRGQFDFAYSAKTSPMKLMNLFLYWLGAEERIAYVDGGWHSRLITQPRYEPKERCHQALKGLRLVLPDADAVPKELYPTLHVEGDERDELLVSVTTTRESNRLNVQRYAALINRLGMRVTIVGQRADQIRAEALAALLHVEHTVHIPQTFAEFMLLLKGASHYFVGDGGVAHIGAALGKKGVVLYGQTHPDEWRPLSEKLTTLYHPAHVDQIDNETIFDALMRML